MNIAELLKECYEAARRNPLIFVPLLAASVFSVLFSLITVGSTVPMLAGMAADPSTASAEQLLAGMGVALGRVFLVSVISAVVYLVAHGMTVAMADLALAGGKPTLREAWDAAVSRIVPIIVASILVGLLVGLGTLLLVIPGVIVAFLLMFTLVSVMVDKANAFDALGRSYRTVIGNFRASLILVLVMIGLGVLAGIASFVAGLIPVLGVILTMAISALYTGYATTFLVRVYRELQVEPNPPPEV
jgi:hypothetical protein